MRNYHQESFALGQGRARRGRLKVTRPSTQVESILAPKEMRKEQDCGIENRLQLGSRFLSTLMIVFPARLGSLSSNRRTFGGRQVFGAR